jgi:integrase
MLPKKRTNKTGRAVRTVDYYLAILRQILDYAVKNKVISYQPYVGIKRLRKGQTKPDPLLRHEFEQLKETAPAQQKNMWQFFAYTGVRPGELCALAWEDIDLNSGEANIARNLTQEGLFGPPKTEAGYRTIKLLEPALEALRAQKELTGGAPKVPITFTTGSSVKRKRRNCTLCLCLDLRKASKLRTIQSVQLCHYGILR